MIEYYFIYDTSNEKLRAKFPLHCSSCVMVTQHCLSTRVTFIDFVATPVKLRKQTTKKFKPLVTFLPFFG